ncbi:MAG: DUF4012 domain-containing protein [Candidatus Kerfeldbacteria bacterium]|nr:DUF4012 domain-containing protein [Candidatus Kerfeldbacteria bacterium]
MPIRPRSGFTGVPRENVIDLRAMRKQELQHIDQPRESRWKQLIERATTWWTARRTKRVIEEGRQTRESVIVSRYPHASLSQPIAQPKAPVPTVTTTSNQVRLMHFTLPAGWPKRLVGFATMCLVIILPIIGFTVYQRAVRAEGTVLGISSNAYDELQAAGGAVTDTDFISAAERFRNAATEFSAASTELDAAGGVVTSIATALPGKVKSASALLEAGTHLSQAGAQITELISLLQAQTPGTAGVSDDSTLTSYLAIASGQLDPIIGEIEAGTAALANVRINDLPEEYRAPIQALQESAPQLNQRLRDASELSDVLLYILGHDAPRRYLLVFQNNRELRPTGGFMGSIALVDMYRGAVQEIAVPGGGIYDIAGQLKDKLISPKPLWIVNPHWNIQDSNWFPDFPTSAKKTMWFFERTGGTSVDGVLTLTPTVIERLLEITGPLDMQERYGVTVDASNFVREAQVWAEVTYDREENQPKRFIGDMMPLLMNKVFNAEPAQLLSVVEVMLNSLQDRNMLVYFTDADAQAAIHEQGWDGALAQPDGDYLAVVNTNIGGGKTDQVIDQLIEHTATIESDGSVIDTVRITRSHTGSPFDKFAGQANVSYVRLYVPQGSEFLTAEGFDEMVSSRFKLPDTDAKEDADLATIETDSIINEQTNTRITNEFGKTVFGNWMSIDPGESQTMTITYRLPGRLDFSGWWNPTDVYSLYLQQQPGAPVSGVISRVTTNPDLDIRWTSGDVDTDTHTATWREDLLGDRVIRTLIEG